VTADSFVSEQLARHDEATLAQRTERYASSRVHGIIPNQWFAAASSECRDMYVDGHFYGCISLSQAVAEGIAKFLLEKHSLADPGGQARRCQLLEERGIIDAASAKAFEIIRGTDRNHFHHLNKQIETDWQALKSRAAECVEALYSIESVLFAFDADAGAIRPRNRDLWIVKPDGTAEVFLRLT
jgi:hypothetical protein